MSILESKLLGTAILLAKPEVKETTAGGIMLPPEIIEEKNNTTSSRDMFKVLNVGHQVVNINVNDKVYLHRNAAHNHHTINKKDYTVVREDEVLAVIQFKDKELESPQTAIKLLK